MTNASITRRKTYFFVESPEGEAVFLARHFWPCVEFLDASGITAYQVAPSEPQKDDQVASLAVTVEKRPWQK